MAPVIGRPETEPLQERNRTNLSKNAGEMGFSMFKEVL